MLKKSEREESEIIEEKFDWVSTYTIATTILGWSCDEFWAATPRKYFSIFNKYCEINGFLSNPAPKALVGKEAFQALASIAGKLR